MEQAHIYSQLTLVFHEVFDDLSIALSPETSANDISGWDSLTHVRLIMTIQRAFGVRFSTSEILAMQTVGDLAKAIAVHLSRQL